MVAELKDLLFEQELRRHRKLVWKTKTGKEIPLSEMTDEHLNNAIRMLEDIEEMRGICEENWSNVFNND